MQVNTYLFIVLVALTQSWAEYTPDWKSLDARPLPGWYDEAKVGIFLHWGVYSVPSFGHEWFWWYWKGSKDKMYQDFMKKNYRPDFSYEEFAANFRAEFFDPNWWADLVAASGARYFVPTSKHHDGYCLWPTNTSWLWNSADVGPNRDLIGELAEAIRSRTKVRFGLYHSLYEWFNPLYLGDKRNGFKTQDYPKSRPTPALHDLVMRYKPDILWSDGDWEAPDSYWRSPEFLAWLYNESPVRKYVVTNDRWGAGCMCHHGGFYTCSDRYHPSHMPTHKWENCMSIDKKSWGFRREMQLLDILSPQEIIYEVAYTVAMGGNILLNVGATSWGTITPIFEERLRQLGSWLKLSGEAIYATKPWTVQRDAHAEHVWFTSKPTGEVYAIITQKDQVDNCATDLDLASVSADVKKSKFLLIDGSPKGTELKFTPNTTKGVTLHLREADISRPKQFASGCVVKMSGVDPIKPE